MFKYTSHKRAGRVSTAVLVVGALVVFSFGSVGRIAASDESLPPDSGTTTVETVVVEQPVEQSVEVASATETTTTDAQTVDATVESNSSTTSTKRKHQY